jgi:hypothetical protein
MTTLQREEIVDIDHSINRLKRFALKNTAQQRLLGGSVSGWILV